MQEMTPEQLEQIESLIFAGKKIEAIKLVREQTGLGLKEAKDFVDAHSDQLRQAYPEKMPKAAGCGSASLIFLALTLGLTYLFFY